MENSINKNEGTGLNRCKLLKTGLALAGASDVIFTANELKQFHAELAKIEIRGERLPKFVLDFSEVEALPKQQQ